MIRDRGTLDEPATGETVATLVPELAVELSGAPGNIHRAVEGSMLSADISGFTALSEKLADRGKSGAEEITRLLNECFTRLIDAAYEYGGQVLKFGGDALLILFRGQDDRVRAAAAGLAMQEALRSLPQARRAQLTMTVGVAEGPFDVFLVGSAHRELLITGPAASTVIELEGAAEKGDTLVSPAIADALPDTVRVRHESGGWVIEGTIDAPRPGPAIRRHDIDYAPFIAPGVLQQFSAFAEFGGEHRIVTVGFLLVAGVDDHIDSAGPAETADRLGGLVDAAMDSAERCGATVLHTDIAEGGMKFIMCAGAPVATGNTADGMVHLALELAEVDSPFVLRQGVQHGRVFAGFLGSPFRRAYTLMGDTVNTAARMLGKADDREIVAVDNVIDACRSSYATESIPPFTVKGKTEPITASKIRGETDSGGDDGELAPLVGRSAEMDAIGLALASDVAMIELSGPAGAGKSRLLAAIRDLAGRQGRAVVAGECSPYSSSVPYAVVRTMMRRTLGLDSLTSAIDAGKALLEVVRDRAPALEPMTPIIALPMGADVPPTPEADAVDSKFLKARTQALVGDFLRTVIEPGSLLVIEDTHWIDAASAELLDAALRPRPGDLFTAVLTRRPEGTWRPTVSASVLTALDIEPLTDDDIGELAIATAGRHITDAEVAIIVERSGGNPLFAIEMARAVGQESTSEIPDTVEELIAERIDTLDPDARQSIRVASVFGYRLLASDLRAIESGDPDAVTAQSDLVSVDHRGMISFNHALYRDVAYEGLPFTERRRLHLAVGEHLEGNSDEDDAQAALLALHFAQANDSRRAWKYGRMAGDLATVKAATAEAATNYRRALDAASRRRDLEDDHVIEVAMALGDAESLLGDLDAAERAYQRARAKAGETHHSMSAMLRIGRIREKQGRFDDAGRWYDRVGERLGDRRNSDDLLRVRSQMHYYRSGLHHRSNDQQACVIEARRALGAAEDADDLEAMAEALMRLQLATTYLGREDRIGYGPKALELFTELGRYERISAVLNNLGIEHYFAGRWSEAAENYQRSADAGLRAGSLIEGMLGALNGGEILSDQGHWDEAIELFHQARRNWADGRYPMGAAVADLYLGIAHSRRGDTIEAREFLERAISALGELKVTELENDARVRLMLLDVLEGRSGVAEVDALLVDLDEDPALRARALRTRAVALAAVGRWAEARAELLELLPELNGYERALTLRTLGHYDGDDADPAWTREASEIFESLGVKSLQPLPGEG